MLVRQARVLLAGAVSLALVGGALVGAGTASADEAVAPAAPAAEATPAPDASAAPAAAIPAAAPARGKPAALPNVGMPEARVAELGYAVGLGKAGDTRGSMPSLYTGRWFVAKAERTRRCIVDREANHDYRAVSRGGHWRGGRSRHGRRPAICCAGLR